LFKRRQKIMKKSTLITTIAMIVVVVVALSTATYAWFSSSTVTTVETYITTQAGTGWMLYGGTESAGTVTYSTATSLNLTLMNGLYSPTGAIGTTLASKSLSTSQTLPADFYSAVEKGGEYHSDEGKAPGAANYIRAVNGKSAAKDLKIRIIVYLSGTSDAEYRAGSAFSTYIYATDQVTNPASGTAVVANTAYGYGPLSNGTTGLDAGYYTATYTTNATLANAVYSGAVNPQSDTPSTGWSMSNAQYTNGEVQIESGTPFYTITCTFQNVAASNAVNIMFYAWLDGWKLDDTARGARVNVVYEFGDEFNTISAAA
jgi:hypothetical protein